MPEPIVPTPEAVELETLRRTNAELLQKSATRKARIEELQASATTFQTRATEAEARVRELLVDGPVSEICSSISVAPEALRNAIEADYKIEMRDGILTLINRPDDKSVTFEGKPVPMQADAIKNFLLASKDEAKLKLYRAILIVSKGSGGAGIGATERSSKPKQALAQFGLGRSFKN